MIIRGVNLYPSEAEKLLMTIEELAPSYQLVLAREKALDTLEVQVEITEQLLLRWGAFDSGHAEFESLTQKIQTLFKDKLGLTADVTLLKPKSVPRSEGKAVRVIDKRQTSK